MSETEDRTQTDPEALLDTFQRHLGASWIEDTGGVHLRECRTAIERFREMGQADSNWLDIASDLQDQLNSKILSDKRGCYVGFVKLIVMLAMFVSVIWILCLAARGCS